MSREIKTFGDIEVKKINLPPQDSYFWGDVYIKKILVSNKISFSGKNY